MKRGIIILVLFCFSCISMPQIQPTDLYGYEWIFFAYAKVQELKAVRYIYNRIIFVDDRLLLYFEQGFATLHGETLLIEEREGWRLKYEIKRDTIIIFCDDNKKVKLKIQGNGDFKIDEKIFKRQIISDYNIFDEMKGKEI